MKIFSIKQEKSHLVMQCMGVKLKVRNEKDATIFPYRKHQPLIAKYKYVHVMNNGLHSINVINFVNKYFPNDEHCFIFPKVMFSRTKMKLVGVNNVYFCPVDNINLDKTKKIIIHGLFDSGLVNQLFLNKKLLAKTYWFIWGGDLYSAPNNKKENYVRSNVAGILTAFDKEVYETRYGSCKEYFDITYPHDMDETMLVEQDPKDYVHIQINNSADVTTLEMLDILSKFKDENIKISTILSYKTVGDDDAKLKIMKKGYEIFGSKFNPIIEFMSREDYANHLASVDIYISNQNRQQGNGNASFICSLGHKVFVKSDTSVYKKYNPLGIRYYDTYDIPNMSFEEFCHMDKDETALSVKLLKERMKDETKVKQWSEFFENDKTFKSGTMTAFAGGGGS